MSDNVRLGVVAVASPLEVGAGEAPLLQESLAEGLRRTLAGMQVWVAPQVATAPASAVEAGLFFSAQRVDALCIVAASWFEDYIVLDLLEECSVPLVLWARPGMETGALCGTQQLGFMLRQLDYPYLSIFDSVEDVQALQRAAGYVSVAALRRALRRARIGQLGYRVEGMTETTAHELALKKVFGPRVVGLDTHLFLERTAAIPDAAVAGHWEEIKAQVGQVTVSDTMGIASLRVYEALRETIAEGGLAAVAVGCYPHLMGKVCLAASLLGAEGIPVACEGDVNGALGMLILGRLGGEPVHNTDLLDPIPAENSIVFSHCGSGAFCLAESPVAITLGPVRLMNQGVCCLFPARAGAITLLNVVPSLSGYRLAVLYGEAVHTEMVFPGNPLRVRFASSYRDILAWIATEGLGHHWMAAYGDLRQSLADLAGLVGCDLIMMPE